MKLLRKVTEVHIWILTRNMEVKIRETALRGESGYLWEEGGLRGGKGTAGFYCKSELYLIF